MKTNELTINLNKSDEIIEREAKRFGGNASHVILPAKYVGRKVVIICSDNPIKNHSEAQVNSRMEMHMRKHKKEERSEE